MESSTSTTSSNQTETHDADQLCPLCLQFWMDLYLPSKQTEVYPDVLTHSGGTFRGRRKFRQNVSKVEKVCLKEIFLSIQKLKMALITKLAPWQIPNAVMSEWLWPSLYASQWVTAVKFHNNNSLAKKQSKIWISAKTKIRIKDYRLATSHLQTFKAMQPVHQYPLRAELVATSTKVVVRSQHAACGCAPAQVRSTRGCCCSVAVLQNWNV